MPAHLLTEGLQCPCFAGLPAPLDELNNRHPLAMAKGAQHQPKPGGGFSLALAGEHQHQPLLLVAFLHPLLLHLLAPLHPFAVTGVVGFGGELAPHAQLCGGLIEVVRAHGGRGVVGFIEAALR